MRFAASVTAASQPVHVIPSTFSTVTWYAGVWRAAWTAEPLDAAPRPPPTLNIPTTAAAAMRITTPPISIRVFRRPDQPAQQDS